MHLCVARVPSFLWLTARILFSVTASRSHLPETANAFFRDHLKEFQGTKGLDVNVRQCQYTEVFNLETFHDFYDYKVTISWQEFNIFTFLHILRTGYTDLHYHLLPALSRNELFSKSCNHSKVDACLCKCSSKLAG